MERFGQIFDVSLLATVGLIFFLTLLGAYIRSRSRDTCLKSFQDFPVTVERCDGRIIWGVMELESSGLELRYLDSVQDVNHVESSYLLYASEFAGIQAIYRYVDELDEEDKHRRERQLHRYFHPGPLVRVVRATQHFFSLASDSLSEVLGMIMGSLRKPAGRYITDASDEHLRRFSTTVVGSMGSTFDPLLERLVGQKVVFDLLEGDVVHEHVGIFKNYSPDFVELLDVQYPQGTSVDIDPAKPVNAKTMSAVFAEGIIRVTNHTPQTMLVRSLTLDDEEELLNVVVDGDETIELHPEKEFQQAKLDVNVVRELDMIVPRSRCVVRHRAERYEPAVLPEIIFDIGVRLRGDSVIDAREVRLRRRLKEYPDSALVASNLGSILMQKQQFLEAKQWLQRAYQARFSLPDNGRRTLMLLHELDRAITKTADVRAMPPAISPLASTASHEGAASIPAVVMDASDIFAGPAADAGTEVTLAA